MTNNQIILQWRGECRHELYDVEYYGNAIELVCTCGFRKMADSLYASDTVDLLEYALLFEHKHLKWPNKLYETDLSAWGPELYQAIEGAGLWLQFCEKLTELLMYDDRHLVKMAFETYKYSVSDVSRWYYSAVFAISKATPEQKSQALVRAIKELEGK
jgi:hypothetical protein